MNSTLALLVLIVGIGSLIISGIILYRLSSKKEDDLVSNTFKSVLDKVEDFTKGIADLRGRVEQVQDSVKEVVSFQDIFKVPKLRGEWGEEFLAELLHQGLPKELYESQHHFTSGEIVDAVLKLPNGKILPIDSKFNSDSFERMTKTEDKAEKELYRKEFISAVKLEIDKVSSKYIIPAEKTTDIALMYIPAEAIYYDLITNIGDSTEKNIPKYAKSKKVILVSPNTFYITVYTLIEWFKNVEINKKTTQIRKNLDTIYRDSNQLSEGFKRLGKHISDAKSAYDLVEKRLDLMVDRVRNVIEIGDGESDKQLTIEDSSKNEE